MTKPRIYTEKETAQLLTWIKASNPKAYAGLVKRFTAPERAQVAGIWDSISSAASSITSGVTNFLNSQGAQKLFTAATPFLQSELEKQQLKLNLQRMQNGLPVQYYPQASAGASSVLPYGTDPQLYPAPSSRLDPWPWWALGLLAAAGVGTVLLLRDRN